MVTLGDILNQIGIVTISLSLLQSAISLYIYERRRQVTALSRLFDSVSLVVFVIGYVAVNVALPWAAWK